MSRRLPDAELDQIRHRAISGTEWAHDRAPTDRAALLEHIDWQAEELRRVSYLPQQLPLFELAQRG